MYFLNRLLLLSDSSLTQRWRPCWHNVLLLLSDSSLTQRWRPCWHNVLFLLSDSSLTQRWRSCWHCCPWPVWEWPRPWLCLVVPVMTLTWQEPLRSPRSTPAHSSSKSASLPTGPMILRNFLLVSEYDG